MTELETFRTMLERTGIGVDENFSQLDDIGMVVYLTLSESQNGITFVFNSDTGELLGVEE